MDYGHRQLLLGRQLRDFLPGTPKQSPIMKTDDLRMKWKEVAEWRKLALAPRSVRIHEKLSICSKELPPLQIGDHVMNQNQLGNKPKQWDKRGVIIQAQPETRQYKVMTFGSRRITRRNRRFLKKIRISSDPRIHPNRFLKTPQCIRKCTCTTTPYTR